MNPKTCKEEKKVLRVPDPVRDPVLYPVLYPVQGGTFRLQRSSAEHSGVRKHETGVQVQNSWFWF